MIEPATPSASSAESSPGSVPTTIRWRILALLMAYAGLVHYNRVSISTAGTEHIMEEYGIDEISMGMVYSSYLFLYTLFMLPGGWLLDKIGPKRALLVVGIGSSLLVPLTGLMGRLIVPDPIAQKASASDAAGASKAASANDALPESDTKNADKPASSGETDVPAKDQDLAKKVESAPPIEDEKPKVVAPLTPTALSMLLALCLIRALLGIVSAPIHPAAARAVSFWMPLPARGMSNGMVTAAAVAGIALTPYLSGYLMDQLQWQNAFVIAGGMTLVLTIGWWIYATDHPDQHPATNSAERQMLVDDIVRPQETPDMRASLAGMLSMFRNSSLVLLATSYAAYSYVQYLFFYWLQFYFDKVLKLDSSTARLYTTINLCAMVVGMLSGGWLVDRFQLIFGGRRSRAITPVCGLIASGVFLLIGANCTDRVWVVTSMAISMGTLGLCEAPFWLTGVELGGRRGGLSGAFLNTIGNVGGIIGPILTPLVSKHYGWQISLYLASAICILGAIPWVGIIPNSSRPQTETPEGT